jgi:hypothetical protein
MVEDVLFFNRDSGYTTYPETGDSSDYTYGTDHDILEARYRTSRMETNRAQVSGDGVFTEDFDWASIDLVYDAVSHDADLTLDTTTRAHRRGDVLLRDSEMRTGEGFLLVPLNCGQELYDVVTITDPRAPLSAATRRVLSLEHFYNPRKGLYTLKLGLGSV